MPQESFAVSFGYPDVVAQNVTEIKTAVNNPVSGVAAIAGTVNNPASGVAAIAGMVNNPATGVAAIAGTVNNPASGVAAIAGMVNNPATGVAAIAGTLNDPATGVAAIAGTVNNPATGVAAIANTLQQPEIGIGAIARQLGLSLGRQLPPPLPDAIANAEQMKLAVKFVDDLVPLSVLWLLLEEPRERHRHEQLLQQGVQHERKILVPEQFFPSSFVQFYAIVPDWFIFTEMRRLLDDDVPDLTKLILHWNHVRDRYASHANSDPIPTSPYLEDCVGRVFELFKYVHRYLRNE
jgi:hypothetical protein